MCTHEVLKVLWLTAAGCSGWGRKGLDHSQPRSGQPDVASRVSSFIILSHSYIGPDIIYFPSLSLSSGPINMNVTKNNDCRQ